ncbi:MAG: hypothetical protein JNK02_01690 [Planctomycetes bacterium]|nr:hypothetical protein [Planctomycetota bacterium]
MDIEFQRMRNGREVKVIVRNEGASPVTARVDLTDDESRSKAEAKFLERFPSLDPDALREQFDNEAARPEPSSDTLAERILGYLKQSDRLELFHSPDGAPFAWVRVRGSGADGGEPADLRETLGVRSRPFREWLTREVYLGLGKAANGETIATVVGNLVVAARYEGPERAVAVRLAEHDGAVWLDLANDAHELVRVDRDGWRIVGAADSDSRLVRRSGMLALPSPVRGGTIDELRGFLNVDASGWVLVRGFALMLLSPSGPFPILIANGEQGSAKSTLSKVLRRLVDPNLADARRPPKDSRDLAIAATNSRLVVFDNLSGIPEWLGDDLCALTSGNGFATRELYSDTEETIFQVARPVILNGIDDLASRGDVADRSIVLSLKRIDDRVRREERTFWEEFDEARPRILGALLDALSCARARSDTMKLDRNVRLADFARLVEAAAPALGLRPGEFLDALFANRDEGSASVLDGSPFALAVRDLMNERADGWEGTAGELRKLLTTEERGRDRAWPRTPRKVGDILRRYAPALRSHGIEVVLGEKAPDASRRRIVRLVKRRDGPSVSSEQSGPRSGGNGLDGLDDPSAGATDPYAEAERAAIEAEAGWGAP